MPQIALVDFEDGTTQGFTAKQYGTLAASTMDVVSSPTYQGAYSGRLTANGSGSIEASTAILPVAPWSDVAYSLALSKGNVAREISVQVSTYNGTTFKEALGAFTLTATEAGNLTGWLTVGSASMHIGDADGVSFVVQMRNVSSGNYAYFDSILLERVNPEGSYAYYESWNQADGSAGFAVDQPWNENIPWAGVQTGFHTNDGRLSHSTGAQIAMARMEVDLPADQGAQVTVHALPVPGNTSVGDRAAGVVVRMETGSSPDSWYCFDIVHNGTYSLWKLVNGSRTNFVSGAALPGGLVLPATIQLTAQGTKIQATYRGTVLQTVTDSSVASGRAGVYLRAAGSVTRVDDYSAGPLEKIITLVGTLALDSANVLRVPKTLSAALSVSGLTSLSRAVPRAFSGSLSLAGTYSRRVLFSTAGTVSAAGVVARRANKSFAGTASATSFTKHLIRIWRRGDVAMTSTVSVPFLGRVLGAAGAAIMRIKAAGEARMRFLRR